MFILFNDLNWVVEAQSQTQVPLDVKKVDDGHDVQALFIHVLQFFAIIVEFSLQFIS